MKRSLRACLLCYLVLGSTARAQTPLRYTNEVAQYRFYAVDPWRSLVPLVSTMADVRKVLGEPADAKDMADYFKPYPGDAVAKQPLFTYRPDLH